MAADLWFKKQMQEELQSGVKDQEHSEHPREELGTRARELRMQSRLTARELCSGRKETYPVKGGHEDFRLSRPCCFYCNSSVLEPARDNTQEIKAVFQSHFMNAEI